MLFDWFTSRMLTLCQGKPLKRKAQVPWKKIARPQQHRHKTYRMVMNQRKRPVRARRVRVASGARIVPNPQRVDSQRRVKINPTP
jgi:hypothetical protein